MELMLGLPPMNQMDATATPMFDCFTNTPDFTAYTAKASLASIAIGDQRIPPKVGLAAWPKSSAFDAIALKLGCGHKVNMTVKCQGVATMRRMQNANTLISRVRVAQRSGRIIRPIIVFCRRGGIK